MQLSKAFTFAFILAAPVCGKFSVMLISEYLPPQAGNSVKPNYAILSLRETTAD